MENIKKTKLSLEPYKGTRDFYPEDQAVQNYIFSVWRKVAESFGYVEYDASILEETDLYRAKSGEEIVNEQTYSFTDRGGREVTIRPEMTPTVARMVAQKRNELIFPLRWFSMPNLFRYERPQRGRLREHWQLNVDIFGVESVDADVEVINVGYSIMKVFGATDESFEIRVNSRKLTNHLLKEYLGLDDDHAYRVSKLIDRMHKMKDTEFIAAMTSLIADKTRLLTDVLYVKSLDELGEKVPHSEGAKELDELMAKLKALNITNVVYDPTLMRGFDYYTGIIFEIYDTSPVNNRALFGGGRYDDLVGIFGVEKVPGAGFGMGDVTVRDFLNTHGLLPTPQPTVEVFVGHLEGYLDEANKLGAELRAKGLNVAVDLTDRKVSAQVKTADRQGVPFVVVVGEEEVKSGLFKVKDLKQGKEKSISRKNLADLIKNLK